MPRVTRSRSNAESNKSVVEPRYAEPGSDIEELEAEERPAPEPKAKSKTKPKTQRAQKSSSSSSTATKTKTKSAKNNVQADIEPDEPDEADQKVAKKEKSDHVEDRGPGDDADDADDAGAPNDDLTGNDYELTEKELKQINNAFDMNLASLRDEYLSSANVKTAMRHLGFEPRADEIRALMKKFANSKGKINRDCFHKIMAFKYSNSPGMNDKSSNDEISKVFNLFDINRTGKISLENLKSIAKELNEELTEEDLKEMISEADTDGDFLIDKTEFQNIMKKTSLY